MRQAYRTIQDVLASPWAASGVSSESAPTTDRILRSTKLEDSIYAELRSGDEEMDGLESAAGEKLRTFPALSRDIYQSFYSLALRRNEESALSGLARKFNRRILDHVTESEDYPTVKNICEGREPPAYEAAAEFIARTAGELDALLSDFGGDKGALNTLGNLSDAERKAAEELAGLLERLRQSKERNETLEKAAVEATNKAESKRKQAKAVIDMIDLNATQRKDDISAIVQRAVKAASDKAEETGLIISAWGDGSTQGDNAAWGKAVALPLLDIAEEGGRSFALIHFSGPGDAVVSLFCPGEYTAAEKMTAAETFLDGGTDFETPMRKTMSLIEENDFEKADVVFITDGECELNEAYARELCEKQTALGFTVTGILLDANSPGMEFSPRSFCRNIYRTSELMGDEIVQELVNERVQTRQRDAVRN